VESEGELTEPAPGGDLAPYRGASDCDLGLSPITNTLPVLRCGLLGGADPVELVLPWVSVPHFAVEPLPQRYTHLVRDAGVSLVRFESEGFSADIVFDSGGIVVDYPADAGRLRGRRHGVDTAGKRSSASGGDFPAVRTSIQCPPQPQPPGP